MITTVSRIAIAGLPLAFWFGIVTFACLLITATLGVVTLKGLYRIPFKWHMRMAVVTIFFAVIHVILISLLLFF